MLALILEIIGAPEYQELIGTLSWLGDQNIENLQSQVHCSLILSNKFLI